MVFDEYHNGVPVAFIITSNSAQADLVPWLKALNSAMTTEQADWCPKCFHRGLRTGRNKQPFVRFLNIVVLDQSLYWSHFNVNDHYACCHNTNLDVGVHCE